MREVDTGSTISPTIFDAAGAYAYFYDYAGRLLSATSTRSQPVSQSFTYDSSGRMRSNSPVGTYQYRSAGPDHAPYRIQRPDSSFLNFTFDANGNVLTGLDGQVMTYDGENRPLSVTRLAKVTCYTYGADGSRLRKIENVPVAAVPCSNATGVAPQGTTVYFGAVEISNFGQGAAEVYLAYPHPNVRQTTTKSGAVVSTAVSYLHRDQLGSVRLVSDTTGQRVEADVYRPFGEQQESPTGMPPE